MVTDELSRPLGTGPRARGVSPVAVLLTLLGGALAAGAVWLMLGSNPDAPGGETAGVAVPIAAEPEPEGDEVLIRAAEEAGGGGVSIRTPEGQLIAGDVQISQLGASLPVVLPATAIPDLVQPGEDGPLPQVGADGLRPFDAYARPPDPTPAGRLPRIAIVVGGLGISSAGTERALASLPGEVSLAMAPYGTSLEDWAARARASGHEVLLQLPLEPIDFPATDPGPHTLTVAASDAENLERLRWLLSRFTAYAGVVTYAGGRFTADPEAMRPMIDELASRGLMLVDDGSSARARTAEVATGVLPFADADLVLDASPDAAAIAARFSQLEAIARERGYAVASASAFAVTVDRILQWAETAEDRGFDLVPVTALANDPTPFTAPGGSGSAPVVLQIE